MNDSDGIDERIGRWGVRYVQVLAIAVVVAAVAFAIVRRSSPNGLPGPPGPPDPGSTSFLPSPGTPEPASSGAVVADPGSSARGERLDLEIQYLGTGLPSPDEAGDPSSCGILPLPGTQLGELYLFSVTLTNHSSGSVPFARSRFSLVDRSNHRRGPTTIPGLGSAPLFDTSGEIAAGDSADGFVFFDAKQLPSPVRLSYLDERQELAVRIC